MLFGFDLIVLVLVPAIWRFTRVVWWNHSNTKLYDSPSLPFAVISLGRLSACVRLWVFNYENKDICYEVISILIYYFYNLCISYGTAHGRLIWFHFFPSSSSSFRVRYPVSGKESRTIHQNKYRTKEWIELKQNRIFMFQHKIHHRIDVINKSNRSSNESNNIKTKIIRSNLLCVNFLAHTHTHRGKSQNESIRCNLTDIRNANK